MVGAQTSFDHPPAAAGGSNYQPTSSTDNVAQGKGSTGLDTFGQAQAISSSDGVGRPDDLPQFQAQEETLPTRRPPFKPKPINTTNQLSRLLGKNLEKLFYVNLLEGLSDEDRKAILARSTPSVQEGIETCAINVPCGELHISGAAGVGKTIERGRVVTVRHPDIKEPLCELLTSEALDKHQYW